MKTPIIMQGTGKDNGTGHEASAPEMAAAVIRERSAAARLVSASEIMRFLEEHLMPGANISGEVVTELLTRLVLDNKDLHALSGADTQWYYSSRSMTEAYAKILLQTLEGPVGLIAETVRHNSRIYQRPIPLEIFEKTPFNLACRQVFDCLTTMGATEGYEDIATTETSISGIYLYSTTYMQTEHAVMLAEWFDVGQSENP
ncbi:MAG: hypothetical protein WA705_31680 [Candidatus Ozemobacteraceae bacterium]